MPDAQQTDAFRWRGEAVERDKTRPAARDDQLTQALVHESTDQRMRGKSGHCSPNGIDLVQGELRIVIGVELEDPLEVFERPRRECYFRQRCGFGRRAGLPFARAIA